jgi:hypothetical protein
MNFGILHVSQPEAAIAVTPTARSSRCRSLRA